MWIVFLSVFGVSLVLLRLLFLSSLVLNVTVVILAFVVTNAVTQFLENSIPRTLMHERYGKGVFITGCDSGFGNALAQRLSALGFVVFAGCLSTDSDGAKRLQSMSPNISIVQVDVTKDDQVDKAKEAVAKKLGKRGQLWAVVNNAGIGVYTEIEWCSLEAYQKVLDVNTLGTIRVTKAFLPMLRNSQGRVVIVASLAGRYTLPGSSAYSMSKYAIVSFADCLRREMKKWNVSVHTIEPTIYKTPMSDESGMKKNLQTLWDKCPKDIQESYGHEYYKDFVVTLAKNMNNAKPVSCIGEVIDDMVDAIAGETPKPCYVPSVVAQVRSKIIAALPTEYQDALFSRMMPKTKPAAAPAPTGRMVDPLKRQGLRRHSSTPGLQRLVDLSRLRSFRAPSPRSDAIEEVIPSAEHDDIPLQRTPSNPS